MIVTLDNEDIRSLCARVINLCDYVIDSGVCTDLTIIKIAAIGLRKEAFSITQAVPRVRASDDASDLI